MGMPNLAKMWTREEVLALPDDGNRYAAVLALFRLLDPYVSGNRLGRLMLSPADLDLRSNQLVQPDLFVVPAIGNRRPARWDECGIPILIVEVLSPSTARYDRMTKRRRYQRSDCIRVQNRWPVSHHRDYFRRRRHRRIHRDCRQEVNAELTVNEEAHGDCSRGWQ